jgi:hypothetical protein
MPNLKTMKKSLIFVMAAILVILASCKKNTSVDLEPNISVANDVVIAECINRYVFNMIIRATVDSVLQITHLDTIDSAVVTFNVEENEYSFEYPGSYCADSVFRSGKIEAELNGNFLSQGCITMVNFTNYYEDGMAVNGTDSIVNSGIVQGNKMAFSVFFMNGTVRKVQTNPAMITWESTSQFLTAANSFSYPSDITFYQFGNLSGNSYSGYTFSATMDTLVNKISCPWYYSGRISVSILSAEVTSGYIDFLENDGCTNSMDYYFNGTIFHWKKDFRYLNK